MEKKKPVSYIIPEDEFNNIVSEPVAEYIKNATGANATPEERVTFQNLRRILVEDRGLLQKLAQ